MFGKSVSCLLFLFSISACAKPNYAPDIAPSNKSNASNDCSIQFENSKLCLTWTWEKEPTSTEMGSLIFKTYDHDGFPIDLEQMPSLVLWMPMMGHGSSPTTVARLDAGAYRASNVFFVMPGEWQFKFQVKSGSNILDEAIVEIAF